MSDRRKGPSGEHPHIAAFRAKAESFDETTMPLLRGLQERATSSAPPEPGTGSVLVVTLHGAGPHQERLAADVRRLVAQLVGELRFFGHTITFASVTYGGEDVVIDQGEGGTPP